MSADPDAAAADPALPASESAVELKDLEDGLDLAVYVHGKMPYLVDPTGQARRYLSYQKGQMLHALKKDDLEAGSLRRALVACLQHGGTLSLSFGATTTALEELFVENCFPAAVLDPAAVLEKEFWSPLLRPAEGDPDASSFLPHSSFKLVVISENDGMACRPMMHTLRVQDAVSEKKKQKLLSASGATAGDVEAAAVADVLGVKDVKRNSKDLVEAAFDVDLEALKGWLEKGYDVDSTDGRGNTALGEAAGKNAVEIIDFLLDEGADPNLANDQGRTPLYRAAFQGHLAACEALLEGGCDPRLRAGDELPESVANSDEVKELLGSWDATKTDKLLEMRRAEMDKKMEEKLTTAAERAAFARLQLAKELVALAEAGDAKGVEEHLETMINESFSNSEKPRANASVRDGRGSTLLMIAAAKGHLELCTLLLARHKEFDPEFDKVEHGVWKVHVNARDQRGWNATSIATFHKQKAVLQLLLDHGGDPLAKNSYGKSAVDFAKDTLDAARAVVEDRSEIRNVIVAWDDKQRERRRAAEREKVAAAAAASGDAAADVAANAAANKVGAGAAGAEGAGGSGGAEQEEEEEDRCTLFDEVEEEEQEQEKPPVATEATSSDKGSGGKKSGAGASAGSASGKGSSTAGKKTKKKGGKGKKAAGSGAAAAKALSPRGKKKA